MSIAASHTLVGPIAVDTETQERDAFDRWFGIRSYTVLGDGIARLPDGRVLHVYNLNVWDNNFYTVFFDISRPTAKLPDSAGSIGMDSRYFQAPIDKIVDVLERTGGFG